MIVDPSLLQPSRNPLTAAAGIPDVLAKLLGGGTGDGAQGDVPPPDVVPRLPQPNASNSAVPPPSIVPPPSAPKEDDVTPPKSLADLAQRTQENVNAPVPPPDVLAASKVGEDGSAVPNLPGTVQTAQAPKLAPLHPSLLSRILPIVGAVGAGMEAAGNRGEAPNAARLQATLQNQAQQRLQAERLHNVEEPEAEARAALQRAQAQSTQNTVPVDVNGQRYYVPQSQLSKILSPQIAGQSRENVQTLRNTGNVDVQNLKNSGRMSIEQMKALIQQGKVARVIPGKDPETGETTMLAYNAQNQLLGAAQNSLAPAQFYNKLTSTTQYMADAAGNIQALPKNTVSGVQLPGSVGGIGSVVPNAPGSNGARPQHNTGAQPPRASGATTAAPIQARPVNGANGQPMVNAASTKWVQWQDPVSGRNVAGPASMAPPNSNPAQLPAQEVRDVNNARHAVNLITKTGDLNKPETQGVLQLLDSLDKEGKLGIVASRWNKFITSGVGTSPNDDPRIIMLINKNMLADTATMLAHFGAAGGRSPQMLQHFLDLANAGRMDGITLRAGVMAMADYMKDRAMMPEATPQRTAPQQNTQPTHVVKVNGVRTGTVVNNVYVPDK